jgi:hypothetical protein
MDDLYTKKKSILVMSDSSQVAGPYVQEMLLQDEPNLSKKNLWIL